ncbi:hypothetical protein [Pseudomonas oryzihabitans]|uniref:hypothetical protein n=1 Tax=Pseudomonas oryzihabitans TaxID=47885 RepID=UPI001ABEF7FD|nr:hypothetical protein [Pseudomonas oryzihabitans]
MQTVTPDIAAFLADPERRARLHALGADGWEMVSVQPVLEGRAQIGQQTTQGNQGWPHQTAAQGPAVKLSSSPRKPSVHFDSFSV